jgi:hypothetical protein
MPRHFRSPLALLAIVVIAVLALAACDGPKVASDGYMLVFDYEGKFIPVEQLHKAPADACDDDHWHGAAITLKNESLSEPHPQCGFGMDGALNVIEVPMPDDYQGIQRTDSDWEFQPKDD